jgi:hypothetical protein
MRDHVKILGILNIIAGSLTACAGLAILLLLGGLGGIIAAAVRNSVGDGPDTAWIAAPIFATIGICIAGFLILLSAPSIIGGIGLLHYKPWSRILMIIVSGFHLLHVPLGTALGVYGLWVLVSEDTRRLFEGSQPVALGARYEPQSIRS